MRINIYLQYGPFQHLSGEGIGRYIAKLVEGFSRNGTQVNIICPYWVSGSVADLFEDEGIDSTKVKIKSNSVGNLIFFLIYHLMRPKITRSLHRPAAKLSTRLYRNARKALYVSGDFILKSSARGVTMAIITAFILIAGLLILSPIIILAGIILLVAKIFDKLIVKKAHSIIKTVTRGIFNRLYQYELEPFTRFAKKQKCDLWFAPAAFWENFNHLPQPRVMCVPDLSPIQFAGGYARDLTGVEGLTESLASIIRSVENCDILVAYNATAFANSVANVINITGKRLTAIPHANNNLDHKIRVMDKPIKSAEVEGFARSCLKTALAIRASDTPYLKGISLDGTDILVYPTRLRPNKNVFNLVRAVEHLVRVRRKSVKLILTDEIQKDAELYAYIKEKRLQAEVIFLGKQSVQFLAALYRVASLAVSSSLFEGALPFTVTEALSVGTPVIISANQVSRQAIPDPLYNLMCFDSHDFKSISQRIEWALDNRNDLLGLQENTLGHLVDRNWDKVALDYLELFNDVVAHADLQELNHRDKIRLVSERKERRKLMNAMFGTDLIR